MKRAVTLKENYEFRRLYQKGASAVGGGMVLYCRKNRLGHNRLGLTVGTKVGHAVVRNRARHVVEECDRVRRAAGAMKRGDVASLGELLNASHASLRDLYEVTGVELDTLAAAAQAHPACAGSRMTGAGFGGCTVSIVRKDGVADFKKTVAAKYTGKIGYEPSFYDCTVEDGIIVTKLS